jgi:branched-chain amino acid aminotransferase/4-amino-4-deoxychorismate lyase
MIQQGVPADDRGLTLGDGLFETVLARAGALVLFDEHFTRLCEAAAVLGLAAPEKPLVRRQARAALEQAELERRRAAVRITWTAGSGGRGLDRPAEPAPRLMVTAHEALRPDTPARLATASVRRNPSSPTASLKTLSYLDPVIARREAAAAGGDEALMLDLGGAMACAAAANLFWIERGRLFTAPAEGAILPGIMRAQVLAAARRLKTETVIEAAPPERLADADGAFLTNSLIGVRPVASLDGQPLRQSPLTAALAAAVTAVS